MCDARKKCEWDVAPCFLCKACWRFEQAQQVSCKICPQVVDERGSSQVLQAPPPSSRDLRVGGPALGEVKHTAGLQAQAQALYQACQSLPMRICTTP